LKKVLFIFLGVLLMVSITGCSEESDPYSKLVFENTVNPLFDSMMRYPDEEISIEAIYWFLIYFDPIDPDFDDSKQRVDYSIHFFFHLFSKTEEVNYFHYMQTVKVSGNGQYSIIHGQEFFDKDIFMDKYNELIISFESNIDNMAEDPDLLGLQVILKSGEFSKKQIKAIYDDVIEYGD
jgi:hypothetical protein